MTPGGLVLAENKHGTQGTIEVFMGLKRGFLKKILFPHVFFWCKGEKCHEMSFIQRRIMDNVPYGQ